MQDEGLVRIDKYLFIAGGPVPRLLSRHVSSYAYTQICTAAQAANLSAQNWACCLEFGCCCIGLYLVSCIHLPLANALFDRAMAKKISEFNANLFDNKPVLSMRGSGTTLQFVFNTNLLEPLPVEAVAQLASDANSTVNPAFMPPGYGYGGASSGASGGGFAMHPSGIVAPSSNPVFAGTGSLVSPQNSDSYKQPGVEMGYQTGVGAMAMPGGPIPTTIVPGGFAAGGVVPSAPVLYDDGNAGAQGGVGVATAHGPYGVVTPSTGSGSVVHGNGGVISSGGVYMGGGGVFIGGI